MLFRSVALRFADELVAFLDVQAPAYIGARGAPFAFLPCGFGASLRQGKKRSQRGDRATLRDRTAGGAPKATVNLVRFHYPPGVGTRILAFAAITNLLYHLVVHFYSAVPNFSQRLSYSA